MAFGRFAAYATVLCVRLFLSFDMTDRSAVTVGFANVVVRSIALWKEKEQKKNVQQQMNDRELLTNTSEIYI